MSGYRTVPEHRSMMLDQARNRAYREAMTAMITPDSIVMDLGCGLGIHGFNAARAGAREVLLVEPEPIIEVTRAIARANGLDNVRLLQESAESLQLDTSVDLIISVLTGNFLLSEDLLPSLFLARDRFLAPGGRLLPDCGRMMVAPVSALAWYEDHIECWGMTEEGLDLGPARRFASNTDYHEQSGHFAAELLAEPQCLLEMDFYSATSAACDAQLDFQLTETGTLHGWMGWCDMRLGEHWFSTSPLAAPSHWGQVLLPLQEAVPAQAGDGLHLHLRRPQHGYWHWKTGSSQGEQQGSGFLAQPLDPKQLHRQDENYHPRINLEGEILARVLHLLDGAHSAGDIANELWQRWPGHFANREAVQQRVRNLIDRYG